MELEKQGIIVSRRRIGKNMKQEDLVSNYTVVKFKPHYDKCNESKITNLVERHFDDQPYLNVIVSNLTYVGVGMHWNYICVLVNLFNRKIIGYSAGAKKDAPLVSRAFASVKTNLQNIQIFHTDRGKEFDNQLIDEALSQYERLSL